MKNNSSGRRALVRAAVLALAAVVIATTASVAVTAPAVASHGITVTGNVNLRTGPATSYQALTVVPRGTSPDYRCWTEGQNVNGVNVWFNVDFAGRNGYISSYYDNSSYRTNSEITTKYGIPRCGASQPSTPAPQTGNRSLEIWFGSPVDGRFPTYADSHPGRHKISYGGDWSIDIPAAAGQQVQVFAAPQDGRSSVTAKVESVRAACASGVVSQGGHTVVVGLYSGSARVGALTYAHVNPTVSVGQDINRWGGSVGTLGAYRSNGCWAGSHAHVEAFNVKNYSCFNGTYRPGQAMNRSNFIGFLGGSRASRVRQACP